ncbi:MAG: hypothetical protein AUG43_02110 [Actinobacteria bacterium 13_1_20CM_3_68_10]|nr:MAG: hypothetical protein AUG43_02110 [Actinobacteria bacterium 13_1_20CM_3_68_10]
MKSPMRSSKWSAHGNIYLLVEDERLTPERARELSAQHKTDGVLEVVSVEGVEAEIAIWNPDGSRAELSGNGTRIAARWLADRSRAGEVRIRVGLQGIEFVPVSVGNPHAVVLGDPAEIERVGPLLETNPRFPGRTNVQVGRPAGPSRIVARIWERGVGETSSSGTSAVAVAAALRGEGETEVSFPGGVVRVRIEGGLAYVTGPAERLD